MPGTHHVRKYKSKKSTSKTRRYLLFGVFGILDAGLLTPIKSFKIWIYKHFFLILQDWTCTSQIVLLKKSGPQHKLCPIPAILLHIRIIIVGMALLARPPVKQSHPYKRRNTGKNQTFRPTKFSTGLIVCFKTISSHFFSPTTWISFTKQSFWGAEQV